MAALRSAAALGMLAAGAHAASEELSLIRFDSSRYPEAVCTDGSSAGYYWKAASSAASADLWLVYLQGGGWCYDESSCRERCGTPQVVRLNPLCTARYWGERQQLSGIFWPENDTELGAANKAFVRYCTSDGHMGDAGPGASTGGWHFRGMRVVQATLTELVRTHGLGRGSGQERMIFGGGSAGARGAMVHLDYVRGMLGSVGARVSLVGFLDSPLWIDEPPYPGSAFPGFNITTQGVHAWANVTHLGAGCAARYAGPEAWKCLFGQYRLPSVQTPYFVVASQYDSFQLGENVGHKPGTAAEQSYAESFAASTRSAMQGLVEGGQGRVGGLSWACYSHSVSTSQKGYSQDSCGGQTMEAAFAAYRSGSKAGLLADSCLGFACGKGC
eukprot:TRINITY_DN996_c0_g1_i1.p1 TRINITY_DN996_c0_g1~~TRINITY_DN996_c0_g1_i1.p1  ORF type:complete len:413 (+),score=79.61 TRINITY_DN996_c0_g1_i1:82-1239(+)